MSRPVPIEINNEFLRVAFERCPAGLLVVDSRGHIVIVNDEVERLSGYRRDELLGQSVEMLVPVRFAAGHEAHRAGFLKSPNPRKMGAGREVTARHREGHEIPVEVGLSTFDTTDGTYVLSTLVDITERRRLEERLRQTQKLEAVGTLASGIAHDFNNILLGVIGYTELARESVVDNETLTEDLDVVLDTAKRGRSLVSRILSFTRQTDPNRTQMSLMKPIAEALQLLDAGLPPGITIRHHFDAATPQVVADATQLHQILTNLAVNAAYAMKQHGGVLDVQVVPISVDREMVGQHPDLRVGLYARISVTDSGTGIPDAQLQRIFDPFYTTKPVGEGTGIGLSVTERIVHSLGGCIHVSSKVSEGSCFEVFLPGAPTSATSHTPELPGASPRPCILHVEDEEHLARLGKRILERANYRVVSHTSSLQALEAFRADPQKFDLVITDNTMPNMTGLELVSKLLEIRPDVPVMMVSGIADSISPEELQRRGIRRLLSKPYVASELRALATELTTRGSTRPVPG